jgi:hypothetical protein
MVAADTEMLIVANAVSHFAKRAGDRSGSAAFSLWAGKEFVTMNVSKTRVNYP